MGGNVTWIIHVGYKSAALLWRYCAAVQRSCVRERAEKDYHKDVVFSGAWVAAFGTYCSRAEAMLEITYATHGSEEGWWQKRIPCLAHRSTQIAGWLAALAVQLAGLIEPPR